MWEREWGGDVQMGVASEWVGLSAPTGSAQRLRRILGFGGRVCGGKEGMKDELHLHQTQVRCE